MMTKRPAAASGVRTGWNALRDPRSQAAEFARGPVDYWKGLLARDPASRDEETATLTLAGVRGLLLDLLTTGDRPRAQRALEQFVRLLEGPPVARSA
jgi:hypothetical protein